MEKEKKEKEKGSLWEIANYLLWGVLTTLVSFISYGAFAVLFKNTAGDFSFFKMTVSLNIIFSNALSWLITVLFAFVTNKQWVFCSKSWKRSVALPELLKFFSARVITGIFELVAVPLAAAAGLSGRVFGIEGAVSKVTVSVVVVIANYVLSKQIIFRHKAEL